MRLGQYECRLLDNSKIKKIYNSNIIFERHRHRYEVNINYKEKFEDEGYYSPECQIITNYQRQ